MGKTLIDTNVVIDFLNRKLPRIGWQFVNQELQKETFLSVITKIELLSRKVEPKDVVIIKDFISNTSVLGITDEVIERTISIRKQHIIKIPDAIIAATALTNRLDFVTRNTGDFSMIKGLNVINPWIFTEKA